MSRRLLLVIALCACSSTKSTSTDMDAGTMMSGTQCTQTAPCALTSGAGQQGTISAAGQVNYYTIDVSSGVSRPIVEVSVDRPAVVSAVELLFTLTSADGMTVYGSRGPSRTSGAVHLTANLAVPGAGTYLLAVRDSNNSATDPRHPYTVSANVIADPNPGSPDNTPQTATPVTLGTPVKGFVASAGEISLLSYSMPADGLLHLVLDQAAANGPLQLEMQVLLMSPTAPTDLKSASVVAQYEASAPGAALHVDVVRLLGKGSYLIELSDASGQNADATQAAEWTFTATAATSSDPQDQNGMSNDTADTATMIPATGTSMFMGVINYDGDHDWFHIAMPASTSANIVEVHVDPQQADSDIQLLWAVGTMVSNSSATCDPSCGPTPFCVNGICEFALHGYHQFMSGETTPQTVRLRQQGDSQDIYIYLAAQGDNARTTHPYALDVKVFPDPDPNEPSVSNDTIPTATPIASTSDSDGGVQYSASGMVSWWDYVDGRGTFQEPEDVDWYALPLPPLVPEPCIAANLDAGVDGGPPDGGNYILDGGYWCPVLADGGPAFIPPPDYGLVMRWHGPGDGTYQLGLQGAVALDGGTACLFSFDQRYATSDGDGGYVLGADAGDPCFCLASAQAAESQFWVRIDGPHRPAPPMQNAYSDQPYGWEFDMLPGQLPPMCQGKCKPLTEPSQCP